MTTVSNKGFHKEILCDRHIKKNKFRFTCVQALNFTDDKYNYTKRDGSFFNNCIIYDGFKGQKRS